MKTHTFSFQRLTCFIVFLLLFAVQGIPVKGQDEDKFVITGTLIKKGSTIDTKKSIMLAPIGSKGGFITSFKDGVLKNPLDYPKSNGSFKIVADRSFIGKIQEFTLVYDFKFQMERNGIPVVIKIDKKTKIVDIGNISIMQKP